MTATLLALRRLAVPPRSRIALAVLLGALTAAFGVGLMASAGYLISRAAERPAVLSLMVTIVVVRVFGLGRPLLRYLERLASHDLALRVLSRVRTRFYARLEPLAPGQIGAYRNGDLLSRMVADIDSLQNLYLRGLGPALVALLASSVSVGVAAAFLPSAALVLTAGLVVGGLLVPALSGILARSAGRREAAARGELSAHLVELAAGAPELVAFSAESTALARIARADQKLVSLARRDALSTGIADGLGLIVTGLTTAGVLALAVSSAHSGHLDRVLIAMLALLALASFEVVTPLAAAARELSKTVAAGGRVLELTDHEVAVADPAEPAPAPSWPFALTLDHVRARYPTQTRPAVDGLTLALAPGEHVALVGPSGIGKTTVVNLLLRFLDPEQGRVTLAGRDLRDYRQADIRRMIAVAGQESHLFTTSIRTNVRLARPDASDEDVERALRCARIWDWIAGLPNGLDTLVGDQGSELSGGQRQRIVLARALLADRPVVVLDEPTAHLDPSTASELMRDAFVAVRDQTVLLITHRSEGLEHVDRVVTLEPAAVGR